MDITGARWVTIDGQHVCIEAIVDGNTVSIPADPMNRHYAAILEQGIVIAEPAQS